MQSRLVGFVLEAQATFSREIPPSFPFRRSFYSLACTLRLPAQRRTHDHLSTRLRLVYPADPPPSRCIFIPHPTRICWRFLFSSYCTPFRLSSSVLFFPSLFARTSYRTLGFILAQSLQPMFVGVATRLSAVVPAYARETSFLSSPPSSQASSSSETYRSTLFRSRFFSLLLSFGFGRSSMGETNRSQFAPRRETASSGVQESAVRISWKTSQICKR